MFLHQLPVRCDGADVSSLLRADEDPSLFIRQIWTMWVTQLQLLVCFVALPAACAVFCHKCGHAASEGARYCAMCRTALTVTNLATSFALLGAVKYTARCNKIDTKKKLHRRFLPGGKNRRSKKPAVAVEIPLFADTVIRVTQVARASAATSNHTRARR